MKKLFFILACVLPICLFSSCGDDDDDKDIYYVTLDTEASSVNFVNNLYLQLALGNYIEDVNLQLRGTKDGMNYGVTQKEAEKIFDSFCKSVKDDINALELPTLDDTYMVLLLKKTVSDPNATGPTVKSQKVVLK